LVGHVTRIGEKRKACRILVGKLKGRRPLEKPRSKWKDNMKMYLRDIEWGSMDWICLSENRDHWRGLVNTVTNLQCP
jgi:hypothetical protein